MGAARRRIDFSALAPGEGWTGSWRTTGVANLRRRDGLGLLEAGSDVFPNDPRPVAFAVDARVRDGAIRAVVERAGQGAGLVLRRTGPRAWYAAILADGQALRIIRREGSDLVELARVAVPGVAMPVTMTFEASGAGPTRLSATLEDAGGRRVTVLAVDGAEALQRAGDPGVLATANTLLPYSNPVLPALGNLHLAPYGVQEGEAFLETPAGRAFLDTIRERSTAAFREIELSSTETPGPTPASVVAATTGAPRRGGALLHVASDLPARVVIEVSRTGRFRRSRRVQAGRTGEHEALMKSVGSLPPGEWVHWRPRLRRRGVTTVGPARRFRVLPRAGSGVPVTLAVGACAAQFGPTFDLLAEAEPDVFVWHGDLNYPDTHGPLAQTIEGYAGIWRDFLANPRLEPVLSRACFAAQRDDHDYASQDSNAATIPERPWGIAPWDALMGARPWYRFGAGLAEVWVLDQRRFKSDPRMEDTPEKTLLGAEQRAWLLGTLARSRAPFKLICSPCTVMDPYANARDGNWGNGFVSERRLLLDHIAARVSGQTLFLTGDTHVTMVYDRDGVFEARACPLDIPEPNDLTIADPGYAARLRGTEGVAYASGASHFSVLDVRGAGGGAVLDYRIVRQDGAVPYRRRFEVAPAGGV